METELIIISEYCTRSKIEPEFIIQLENERLIEVYEENDIRYIHISQLKRLEQYAEWYYNLSINIEGIDVIHNLLDKIDKMQGDMARMKQRLLLIDSEYFED